MAIEQHGRRGGETLTVDSVNPVTRATLRSVVVYDRVSP